MQVTANGIPIEVDVRGPRRGRPLLLIMGLGMQLVAWPEEFVERLAHEGFRVIRYDNRDIGLSHKLDHLGMPNLLTTTLRYALRLPVSSPYTLDDLAADAAGVLDALEVGAAHVCGASMGGMVAQTLAATQPQRLRSLTLMMTTSGARSLPQPSWTVRRALLAGPRQVRSADDVVEHLERLLRLIGSPAYPTEAGALRERLRATVERSYHPQGAARQLVAIAAHGDRSRLLGRIEAPTHVIHGRDDPLVPVAAGHDLAKKIRGATLDVIDGMGHDLPQPLLPRFVQGIVGAARRR